MKKNVICILCIAVLAVSMLAGCGRAVAIGSGVSASAGNQAKDEVVVTMPV